MSGFATSVDWKPHPAGVTGLTKKPMNAFCIAKDVTCLQICKRDQHRCGNAEYVIPEQAETQHLN